MVVYADVIQAIVLLAGSTALTWIILAANSYLWTQATAGLPPGHLSLIRPLDDPNLPWLGTLNAASTLVHHDFLSEKQKTRMGQSDAVTMVRLLIVVLMLLAIVVAFWQR